MGKKTENEMEQIQKGLEQFLEREVDGVRENSRSEEEEKLRSLDAEDGEQEPDPFWEEEDSQREEDFLPEEEDFQQEEEDFSPDEEEDFLRDEEDDFRPEDGKEAFAKRERTARRAAEDGSMGKRRERKEEKKGGRAGIHDSEKKKKKHSGLKKLLVVILILLALFFGGLYLAVGFVYDRMNYAEGESGPLKEDGVTSVLLIGSDSRTSGTEGRSDAMILITISDRTRTVHMTSLLRDMYVEIPGHEGNRLNAAYAYGGPELLMETINQNFGTEVYHYAVVNFEAFANLVDAVGGVELELTNEEVQWVNAYLNEYNELRGVPMETDYLDTSLSGNIHLNGAQALAYCRNRYIGTDFARTQRQRNVLSAVFRKLPAAVLTNPDGLINGLFPNLTTNLTQGECMQLALMAAKLMTYDIVQDSLPLDGTYSNASIRGMSVLQVDFDQNRAYLRREIYGEK